MLVVITMYEKLLEQIKPLLHDGITQVSILSNVSAFLYDNIRDLNWLGFYLLKEDTLILGPFQGLFATTEIPLHRGVCGEAATTRQTIVVPDVHLHPDHIACDAKSQSETVVPILLHGTLYGVLDIDSPVLNRFDQDLVRFFEDVVALLVKSIDKLPFFK
jgi:L-methionine (R)-S-oxide reductase